MTLPMVGPDPTEGRLCDSRNVTHHKVPPPQLKIILRSCDAQAGEHVAKNCPLDHLRIEHEMQ